MISKIDKRKRRAKKARAKIKELEAHRLCVHRSSNHIYAQIIAPDDKTIAATSSLCLLYTSPSPRDQRGSRFAACA